MGVRPAVLGPSTQVLPVSDGGPVWGAGPKADLRVGLEQMPALWPAVLSAPEGVWAWARWTPTSGPSLLLHPEHQAAIRLAVALLPLSGGCCPSGRSALPPAMLKNSGGPDSLVEGAGGKKGLWFSHSVVSTLCGPMDCSPPGSSVQGIFQARILEWVAISSSRGSSQPRNRTRVSCIGRQILYH